MKQTLLLLLSLIILDRHAFAETSERLVIGMPVCLTGPCAHSGTNAVHGAELAAADLNKQGGILGRKVVLAVEDSQDALAGARAVTAYRALRHNKDIHFFIGPSWTPGLLALAPIVSKEADSVMISYDGGVSEFHQAGENLFNIRGVDEATTRELARYAFSTGARRLAIFGGQQAWEIEQTRFYADEVKRLGAQVVVQVEPLSSSSDLRDEALKVVTAKPDAILFSAYLQLDLALKALQMVNYTGPKIIAFIDNSRISLAGPAIEEAITFNSLKLQPAFRQRLESAYPRTEATWHGHTAYDAVMALARAIEATKSFDAKAAAKELSAMKMDDAVSGAFEFGGGRLAIRRGDNLKVVRNGTLVPLTPWGANKRPLGAVHGWTRTKQK